LKREKKTISRKNHTAVEFFHKFADRVEKGTRKGRGDLEAGKKGGRGRGSR